nr:hypothetical protein [Rickettsia endosymbiont of Ceutorhynchus assimilis]
MDLKSINETCLFKDQKTLVKLQDMEPGRKYPIFSAKKTQSKFGPSILIELDDKAVFLPKRTTKSLEDHIEQFIDGKYSIIYRGQKDVGRPNQISLFEIVES